MSTERYRAYRRVQVYLDRAKFGIVERYLFRCILVATATLICLTPKATEPLTVVLLSPSAFAATETHHAIQNVLTPALRDMGVVLREVPVPLDPTTTTESTSVAVRRFFETRSPFAVIAFDEARHTVHFGYRTRKGPVEVIQRVLSRIGGPESVGEAVGIIVQELVSALRLDTPDTPSTTGDDGTSADNLPAATASVAATDSDTPLTPAPAAEPPGHTRKRHGHCAENDNRRGLGSRRRDIVPEYRRGAPGDDREGPPEDDRGDNAWRKETGCAAEKRAAGREDDERRRFRKATGRRASKARAEQAVGDESAACRTLLTFVYAYPDGPLHERAARQLDRLSVNSNGGRICPK